MLKLKIRSHFFSALPKSISAVGFQDLAISSLTLLVPESIIKEKFMYEGGECIAIAYVCVCV